MNTFPSSASEVFIPILSEISAIAGQANPSQLKSVPKLRSKLSIAEQNLHQRFQHLGHLHLHYRRRCIGLIPEICRQQIYLKKGYGSIFEYAAKLAGLSKEQVKRVLYLAEKFADKGLLKKCMEDGEIGIGKLAKIASIVTIENQEFWLNQAKLLNTRALETLVRDERLAQQAKNGVQFFNDSDDAFFKPKEDLKFVHVNKLPIENESTEMQVGDLSQSWIVSGRASIQRLLELNLDAEVVTQLLELKLKGHDINQIILELLQKRMEEIRQEKVGLAAEQKESTSFADEPLSIESTESTGSDGRSSKPSRYISVHIKKLLQKEHGTKCSIENCHYPAKEIHHTQRFKLGQNHNPYYLAQLCKQHHQIAHSIDLKYQEVRWRRV